jgi:predicted nucleic acid-binding protein
MISGLEEYPRVDMATFLLDTSVIIDALNNKRGRRALLLELLNDGHLLACCPINVTEVYAGMRPKEEAATGAFLDSLHYFAITAPTARSAGELKREHRRKGITLNLGDVIIAAVALSNQLILLTDNVKHFPMRDLSLYPLPGA